VGFSRVQYVLATQTTSPFSSTYLWDGYPHTPLPALIKFYYLAQLGFWYHQLVILNLEARRKDYSQMLTHHIITTVLVTASYYMNFTRVGIVVLVLMDFVDIVLPVSPVPRQT
jgi:acyl-CoA-dependent ceramide synthase